MSKAIVSVKLTQDYQRVQLQVSLSADLSNPVYSDVYPTIQKVAKITINGLEPDTQYYYGVLIHGKLQTDGRGRFKTFPPGPSSFTCAFGSCAPGGANNSAFEDILNLNPLFFIHMGDIHYQNITTNNVGLFRDGYDLVFSSPRQKALYANIPTMYMWDDHDFTNNDGDGTSPSKPAAQMAYKERVPHYPLNATDGGVGQSWVVGRVRFIMPDIMSYKTPMTAQDTVAKTQFGETQLQWFFNELLKPEPFKIFVNTKPWIGNPLVEPQPSDKWWGFAAERNRIANFIKANKLQYRVAIISGDMHGVAIDDGTNSDYATGGGGAIPVFQAAPLGSGGSTKGGPWSHGAFTNGANGNQYGVMNITDNGTSEPIVVEWLGKRGPNTIVTHTMTIPSTPFVPPADTTPPVVTASPNGGTFTNTVSVTLSANKTSNIYYTINGTTPTTSSLVYSAPLSFGATTTLKFFARDTAGNSSAVQTITYTKTASPIPTGGLRLNLDASVPSSVIATAGEVTQFQDISGNNYHAVTGAGTLPNYDTTTYTKPVIDFSAAPNSGAGEVLDIANFGASFTTGYSIFFALVFDNTELNQKILDFTGTDNVTKMNYGMRDSDDNFRQVHAPNASVAFPATGLAGTMHVISSICGTENVLFLDGIEKARAAVTSTAHLPLINKLRIGANWDGGVANFDGKIGEIIIYNRTLTAQEIIQVNNHLKSKWGVI